ncbi:MAG: Hypothetical protein C75L2_00100013 [Leptospirillum sp. Group II 'C75']|uniref:DUF2062 domain-containing protein n=1 Tax=Leptospirillum sp. Group II 'CF-1' TaxID=1660083 RepID=UPI0000F0C6C5|nr:DUF2062 domain-containing protein [Leptospirillum sp. Group II 'CF-1']AKS22588.1 hypothetical protein ABH19_00700 [Leptospirillum sp. Group II 'CF-1']EAY57897.1 MAG: hypothetical protein UBAL2_82410299 [Leptospirillum rubarum]EIJ75930.1 MAG: Hypothetical protein C75L2_00100013 [Leptospirillum sp. Group II 'C75']
MTTPDNRYGRWKEKLFKLVRNDPDPVKVSLAMALGFSAAFLPPFGFHTLLVMGLGYLFRVSVPLAILGTWINNPWTFIPVFLPSYVLEIKLGGILLEKKLNFPSLSALSRMPYKTVIAQIKLVLWPFIVGSVVFSCAVFVTSFFLVYGFLKYRKGFLSLPL